MQRLIWLPLAGALLLGGAAVAAATPGLVGDATRTVMALPVRGAALLQEVLADLVAQNVITQEQSDAITTALKERVEQERAEMKEKRAEWRAEREQAREEMRQLREQLHGFLEDDVITADEVAQLPEGRVRTTLESLLEDGQVTRQQLRGLGQLLGRGWGHGPGGPNRGGPPPWVDWLPAETDGADDAEGTQDP